MGWLLFTMFVGGALLATGIIIIVFNPTNAQRPEGEPPTNRVHSNAYTGDTKALSDVKEQNTKITSGSIGHRALLRVGYTLIGVYEIMDVSEDGNYISLWNTKYVATRPVDWHHRSEIKFIEWRD